MENKQKSLDEAHSEPLQQCNVSGSRLLGKTNAMILAMIPELKAGGKIGVAGCKDPKDITERLKEYGIEVQSEPMIATQPIKAIHNLNSIEGEIIGFECSKKVQTGFMFYCH
ncbi:hypothetical protein [Chryseobacterium sp. MFBS3-17]|uniref:hypothetical protein n=1 Tax=Chryseobacterium sp. MFBS3-17 TaxID=2886689 RepID=UPI001D0E4475|nr:hypothetical protein [Chryseobacterium sp. MFBS3-17]MCC2590336.1 hypothetical protein [Chryseobacterium sp. MFBS3-17]